MFTIPFIALTSDFNPRSPHGERPRRPRGDALVQLFQSTLPARGATWPTKTRVSGSVYFNPRSPHGERHSKWIFPDEWGISIHAPRTGSDFAASIIYTALMISIHAPRTGSDDHNGSGDASNAAFQSTLPARGATASCRSNRRQDQISIHAPRTGSDTTTARFAYSHAHHFNPRSPHGERLALSIVAIVLSLFQSTLPARGATAFYKIYYYLFKDFNPRSPHGERQGLLLPPVQRIHFNPRSPHGERLRKVTILSIRIIGFAQKVYHKTVLLRISLAENAVILPEKPRNPVRTSLQKAGGLRFARAIRAARPYSISSPSGA